MKRILMAAAIVTVFTASPTMAAIYSGTTLNNYTVTLVDLDLEDSITPSITFQQRFDNLYGYVLGPNSPDPYSANDENIAPISKTSTNNINTATSSISGTTFESLSLQVSGSSLEKQANVESFGYFASVGNSTFFTLSANTRVNFTLNTLNYIDTTKGTAEDGFAYTTAHLEVRGYNLRDEVIVNFNTDDEGVYIPGFSDGSSDNTFSQLSTLSVFLDNKDTSELLGLVISNASTTGTVFAATPSAVPVPAALPLMASALGLFGLSRRKNKATV